MCKKCALNILCVWKKFLSHSNLLPIYQNTKDKICLTRHILVVHFGWEGGIWTNQVSRWWIKQHTQLVMNVTGAPSYVWPDCVSWLVDCHNFCAHEALGYRTPYEKRHGTTPDISAYILFHFWEKIYYHSPDNSFPESKELPGYFLGVANNVGDALC